MNLQKEYMLKLATQAKRIDGRTPLDFRALRIEKNPLEKAEGSARVVLGDTDVLVGVKLEVGQPFPDKPDEGVLIVSAELSPLASPDFETGPPREKAIELARVVDRGIRESGAIDTKKLCITPGEKVWMVLVDIQIINHGGNLIDAYSLASLIALLHTKLPHYDGERIDYEKRTNTPLPMKEKPLAITIHKMADGVFFVDPTLEEEEFSLSRLTVTTKENGHISALQKGGEALTLQEIEYALDISLKKGKELRKLL